MAAAKNSTVFMFDEKNALEMLAKANIPFEESITKTYPYTEKQTVVSKEWIMSCDLFELLQYMDLINEFTRSDLSKEGKFGHVAKNLARYIRALQV